MECGKKTAAYVEVGDVASVLCYFLSREKCPRWSAAHWCAAGAFGRRGRLGRVQLAGDLPVDHVAQPAVVVPSNGIITGGIVAHGRKW